MTNVFHTFNGRFPTWLLPHRHPTRGSVKIYVGLSAA